MPQDQKEETTKLRAACELVLLFYSAPHWNASAKEKWNQGMNLCLGKPEDRDIRVTGAHGDGTWDGASATNEATTKNLCNAVKAALSNEN